MLRSAGSSIGFSAIQALIALTNSIVTARALGLEGRGALAAALLIIGLSRGFAQLGLGETFSLYYRRGRLPRPQRYILGSTLAVLTMGAVTSLIASSLIPYSWTNATLAYLVAASALTGLIDFSVNCARIQPSLIAFNLLRVSHPVLWLSLTVSLWTVLGDLQPRHVIMAGAFSASVVGIGAIAWLRRTPATEDANGPHAKALFGKASSLYAIGLLAVAINNFDMVVATLRGSVEALGLYAAAYGLSRLATPIPMAVGNALYATTVGRRADGIGSELTYSTIRLLFLPLFCLAAFASLISHALIPALLGSEFRGAALAFSLLTLEATVGGLAYVLAQDFQARGLPRAVLIRNLVSLTPLLVFSWAIPGSHIVNGLAALMLACAILRFTITLTQLIRDCPPATPHWFPRRSDLVALRLASR